ncbi:MAG: hypothetical protein KBT82_00045 [Marinobacter sp.]|uniref:hypothetical protein n=1 Tax=Marinobacter sp. TaxID=50741 RepID=UPI001B57AFF3|nr:hypothetical protein [Marinobacter sp.]MBQ0745291.1 hypothetical protein [Marinobacter sp.]MBQ0812573.1 hypothetical protein [Marinobacter sp.]
MPKLAKYISDVEHLLNQRYGVSLAEIGIGEEEWLDRFGGEPAADAVEAFASKYDLTPLTSARFMPFSG